MKQPIDFVILWVDGNDPAWQKEKAKYSPDTNEDSRNIRYRDWENLQYWFRGVEKFAPWVNKIHFVTWGHVPKWLNTNHPKLNIVKHEDFIPKEYLPTFNCNPIEINLHRIKGLSEHFVYFNDDMFITNTIRPSAFFKDGLPCDIAVFNPPSVPDDTFYHILCNDAGIINKHFSKKTILKSHPHKYLNLHYGKNNLRTLLCLPYRRILGFYEPHHASPYLKSTYAAVWQKEHQTLSETSSHRFRSNQDVNQYIFKYWQFCTGNFNPTKNIKKAVRVFDDLEYACKLICKQQYPLLCLNDADLANEQEFEAAKTAISDSFRQIFPQRSQFERAESQNTQHNGGEDFS